MGTCPRFAKDPTRNIEASEAQTVLCKPLFSSVVSIYKLCLLNNKTKHMKWHHNVVRATTLVAYHRDERPVNSKFTTYLQNYLVNAFSATGLLFMFPLFSPSPSLIFHDLSPNYYSLYFSLASSLGSSFIVEFFSFKIASRLQIEVIEP